MNDFSELWPRQFRAKLIGQRGMAAASLAAFKNQDSEYARAHALMVRIYDAAIAAVDGEVEASKVKA